jgi:hypothetical protein
LKTQALKGLFGMQVRHVFATVGGIALGCCVVFAFAGLAAVGMFLGLGGRIGSFSSPIPSPDAALVFPSAAPADVSPAMTPAEAVAARFPSEEDAPPPQDPTFSTASVIPGERAEPFDLNAVSGLAATQPPWPAANGTAPAAAALEEPDPAKPDSPKASHRATVRSPNVLNDAMIASIRKRLNLTAEQQKLWPAVEAALRKIVYTPAAMSPQGRGQAGGPTAYIDPASAEVQELKSAALPLLMRLTSDQKSEVKKLAYIMGLEAMVSQF